MLSYDNNYTLKCLLKHSYCVLFVFLIVCVIFVFLTVTIVFVFLLILINYTIFVLFSLLLFVGRYSWGSCSACSSGSRRHGAAAWLVDPRRNDQIQHVNERTRWRRCMSMGVVLCLFFCFVLRCEIYIFVLSCVFSFVLFVVFGLLCYLVSRCEVFVCLFCCFSSCISVFLWLCSIKTDPQN